MGSRQMQFAVLDLNNVTDNAQPQPAQRQDAMTSPSAVLMQIECSKENLKRVFVPDGCNIVLVPKGDMKHHPQLRHMQQSFQPRQERRTDENGQAFDAPFVPLPPRIPNANERNSRRRRQQAGLNWNAQQRQIFMMTLYGLYERTKHRELADANANANANVNANDSPQSAFPVGNARISTLFRDEPPNVRKAFFTRALQMCQQRTRQRCAAANAENSNVAAGRNRATRRSYQPMESNPVIRDKSEARVQPACTPYAGHHINRAMTTASMSTEMSEQHIQFQCLSATDNLAQFVRHRQVSPMRQLPLDDESSDSESIADACFSSRAQHGGRDGREEDGEHFESYSQVSAISTLPSSGASQQSDPSDSLKDVHDGGFRLDSGNEKTAQSSAEMEL